MKELKYSGPKSAKILEFNNEDELIELMRDKGYVFAINKEGKGVSILSRKHLELFLFFVLNNNEYCLQKISFDELVEDHDLVTVTDSELIEFLQSK